MTEYREQAAESIALAPARVPLILVTMCLGVLVAQIDTSVVTLALKQIGAGLNATISQLQWVVDAYNLVYASLLLTGGTLGDLFGRRRVFLWGVGLFTIGSLLCAAAPTAGVLIAGRALTGLGAALEFPTSLAILSEAYPDKRERTRAIGVWASCNGLAFAIGPTVGGLLVDLAGWRSIFVIVVPFCVVTLGLALKAPESRTEGRRLYPKNQALATAALAALALAVIEGPHWDWNAAPTLICVAGFIGLGIIFFRVEARTDGALIPFALMRNPSFVAALGVAACMTFGMYGMLFFAPLYLQTVTGASALLAGIEMLSLSLVFVIVSQYSGRLANTLGPKVPTAAGMALMGAGEILLALVAAAANPLLIQLAFAIVGCGLGLNTGPILAVAVANAPSSRAGTASGLANTARMVGATLGVAVLGTLFAIGSRNTFVDGLRPALLAGGAVELIGAAVAFIFIGSDALDPRRFRTGSRSEA